MVSVRLHRASSFALIALGFVQMALTPARYGGLTAGAIWFAGTGLAMMLLGALNVVVRRGAIRDPVAFSACRLANAAFVALGVFAVSAIPEPQTIVTLVLALVQAATTLMLPRELRREHRG
jgi:hypothetical protein